MICFNIGSLFLHLWSVYNELPVLFNWCHQTLSKKPYWRIIRQKVFFAYRFIFISHTRLLSCCWILLFQEADERMASMRQELKMLEQKEDHLLKSLGVCCKIKGNMSTDGITKVANERLEMRNRINIIHQQSRVWLD